MTLVQTLPWVAGIAVALLLAFLTSRDGKLGAGAWRIPAALSVAFLLWSLYAAFYEGVTGFWPEHTRNLWGNQIWFDLLLAATIGWWLILPRARAVGMQTWGWLVAVLATGSIGFLAMLARVLFLEERR
ncbi:MAG TPA: hypothetical protein PK970_01590 [Hyphomicrobiaceae bacterium]|nr:hypothetical protein [Hyphomicrobiaceae bacterium]